jgi:hypothetical protein
MIRMDEPLLSQTPEWQDVTPVSLSDESRAAVDINFSAKYLDTFGLLFSCIEAQEKTARVLLLTERCIGLCSSHYTAWDYRFQARTLHHAPFLLIGSLHPFIHPVLV